MRARPRKENQRNPAGSITSDAANADRSIAESFEEIANRYSGRPAVKSASGELTYEELNEAANRAARAVLDLRGETNEPVALLFENDVPAVVAILGALKAGKIYVPLDPSYPAERSEYILADSGAAAIITNGKQLRRAEELAGGSCAVVNIDDIERGTHAGNPAASVRPDSFASILYTSGSTGRPKGVLDTNGNLVYEAAGRARALSATPEDCFSCFSSFSFSASVRKLFPGLLTGASVFVADVKREGVAHVAQWLADYGVTIYGGREVTRQLYDMLSGNEKFPKLRIVTFGGDTIFKKDIEFVRRLLSPDTIMLSFASTEAGTVTHYLIDKNAEVTANILPAGYVVPEKEVLLLDEDGEEVEFGEPGEIAVKSRYMAAGYWRRPELTAEKFTEAPGRPGVRIYHTGDLGRFLEDGCLFHLGRADFQVKVRGYRVETAETESRLLETGAVKEVVVVGRDEGGGHKSLVAYVVPADEPPPTVSALRRQLSEELPAYMVPTRFVFIAVLPRTSTGKVNRRELPDPPASRPELDVAFTAPRTPVEEAMARVWERVLKISPIGADDNFFDLGGHSLRATQVASRILETFHVEVPLADLLGAPTVAGMALAVTQRLADRAETEDIEGMLRELEGSRTETVSGGRKGRTGKSDE